MADAISVGDVESVLHLRDDFLGVLENGIKGFLNLGKTLSEVETAATITGAAVAAMGAALGAAAIQAVEVGEKMNDFNLVTSISVEKASALDFAMKTAGGSLEQLQGALFMMQRRMSESPEKLSEGLDHIHLTLNEIMAMNPDEQFLEIATAFQENTTQSNRAATAMEIFGRQGRDMVPALMKPLQELTEQAERLGLVMSGEDAKSAEELGMAWRSLKAEASWFITDVGIGVLHWYRDLAQYMKDIAGHENMTAEQLKKAPVQVGYAGLESFGLEGFDSPAQGTGSNINLPPRQIEQYLHNLSPSSLPGVVANPAGTQAMLDQALETKLQITRQDQLDNEYMEKMYEWVVKVKEMEKAEYDQQKSLFELRDVMLRKSVIEGPPMPNDKVLAAVDPKSLPGHVDVEQEYYEFGKKARDNYVKAFTGISKDLGNVILQSVEGGGDVWKAIGVYIGNSIAQAVIEKLAVSLAKKALGWLSGVLGVAAAATTGGASLALTAGSLGADVAGSFANGGSGTVTRPTLFMAGEAGPEHYKFTPDGQQDGDGQSMQVHFHLSSWDSEDVRKRGVPQIIQALKQNIGLSDLKLLVNG